MPASRSQFDTFFSRSMEHLPIAQAFFKQHLPPHILLATDLSTLTRIDRTNTNDHLRQRRKDIAYQAQMTGGHTLLICTEHQSRDDITMPARFLSYNAGDLYKHLKEKGEIPVVVNCLFYHGKKAPYPHHDTLQDYYTHPVWGIQELTLRFHVIDSTQLSDHQLLTHSYCAAMELLLKHGRDGKFELEPAAYREEFQQCVEVVGNEYITAMLTYASKLSNPVVGKRIYHFIEQVLINKNDLIMTYGQQLRNEGLQQGMTQGMQEGIWKVARSMLTKGYAPHEVGELTGLSGATIRSMEAGEGGN